MAERIDDSPLCTLRPDDDGSFDELLADGVNVHFEMMSDKQLWIGLSKSLNAKQLAHVVITARGNLHIHVEDPA